MASCAQQAAQQRAQQGRRQPAVHLQQHPQHCELYPQVSGTVLTRLAMIMQGDKALTLTVERPSKSPPGVTALDSAPPYALP